MDLRDEAFYDFVRRHSGKRVAELLAFQECNGVDSLLACPDIGAILRYQSDELNDIKKNTCITLTDGTIVLLPGLESSMNNPVKILKKKRDEINKQAQRIQSITSVVPDSNAISSILSTALPISHTPIQSTSLPQLPISDNPNSLSSNNSLITGVLLNDEIADKIAITISDWLQKKQEELGLINTGFQQGIDFQMELNKGRDGIIMRCKCGSKCAVSQKRGVLMVRIE